MLSLIALLALLPLIAVFKFVMLAEFITEPFLILILVALFISTFVQDSLLSTTESILLPLPSKLSLLEPVEVAAATLLSCKGKGATSLSAYALLSGMLELVVSEVETISEQCSEQFVSDCRLLDIAVEVVACFSSVQ